MNGGQTVTYSGIEQAPSCPVPPPPPSSLPPLFSEEPSNPAPACFSGHGGGGRDKLVGTACNETFSAGAGNDVVRAGGGDDTVVRKLNDFATKQ
jgi:Ca2+-binding RTX toxin-like protein